MNGPVLATVVIPTHTHGETLRYSVPTALRQSVTDIEIFIVGDGVPDTTRDIARQLTSEDARVRFFDFPKGASRGEQHRHEVLQTARGDVVCYLFDDDLWLPDHVAVMRSMLTDADVAFSMPAVIRPDQSLSAVPMHLHRRIDRRLFTHPNSLTCATPTCAAHRMAFYRGLPHGWRAAPRGVAPDKYMWAQFADTPGCRFRSTNRPTALVFPDPPRRDWAHASRLSELEQWSQRITDPEWVMAFRALVAAETRSSRARVWQSCAAAYLAALHMPGGTRAAHALVHLFRHRPPKRSHLA